MMMWIQMMKTVEWANAGILKNLAEFHLKKHSSHRNEGAQQIILLRETKKCKPSNMGQRIHKKWKNKKELG
ncbi:unnamed protein product [Acanthoscelides obtectus]|uniref:Uncharacterized protein n=1 Tax=Acanthoscelides obtectus TaxID=200917 RepID=A0A9P0JP77_ACAOB|nr:unnamed protein product [Acanthoscelides obtectus]CAK1657919.1 hypothetical protein AOBTE_LOCUS20600 [Acanthoscelides obtectus]